MVGLTKSEIDILCEEYEQVRAPNNCGPSSIRQFLQNVNLQESVQPFLMSELVQIDTQLNWISWDKNLTKLIETSDLSRVRQALIQIPGIADYTWFDLEKPSSYELDALLQMAECEMESRKRWGDAIGPAYYKVKYGLLLPRDSHYPGVYLKYSGDEGGRFREIPLLTLRGKTFFGRQRSTDPDELFEEELAEGNRIVVAGKTEATISRVQLAVEVLNRTYAIVTNLSSVNAAVVEGVGPLEPTTSRVTRFDFSVRLPGRRLYFVSSRK